MAFRLGGDCVLDRLGVDRRIGKGLPLRHNLHTVCVVAACMVVVFGIAVWVAWYNGAFEAIEKAVH